MNQQYKSGTVFDDLNSSVTDQQTNQYFKQLSFNQNFAAPHGNPDFDLEISRDYMQFQHPPNDFESNHITPIIQNANKFQQYQQIVDGAQGSDDSGCKEIQAALFMAKRLDLEDNNDQCNMYSPKNRGGSDLPLIKQQNFQTYKPQQKAGTQYDYNMQQYQTQLPQIPRHAAFPQQQLQLPQFRMDGPALLHTAEFANHIERQMDFIKQSTHHLNKVLTNSNIPLNQDNSILAIACQQQNQFSSSKEGPLDYNNSSQGATSGEGDDDQSANARQQYVKSLLQRQQQQTQFIQEQQNYQVKIGGTKDQQDFNQYSIANRQEDKENVDFNYAKQQYQTVQYGKKEQQLVQNNKYPIQQMATKNTQQDPGVIKKQILMQQFDDIPIKELNAAEGYKVVEEYKPILELNEDENQQQLHDNESALELEDRIKHTNWQFRKRAYLELGKDFQLESEQPKQADNDNLEERVCPFKKYENDLQIIIKDKQPQAQHAAFECLLSYLTYSPEIKPVTLSVYTTILDYMPYNKAEFKITIGQIFKVWLKRWKYPAEILQEIYKRWSSCKNLKISQLTMQLIENFIQDKDVKEFIALKPVFKYLTNACTTINVKEGKSIDEKYCPLSHPNKELRTEAQKLLAIIYSVSKEDENEILNQLPEASNIRPAQITEIKNLFNHDHYKKQDRAALVSIFFNPTQQTSSPTKNQGAKEGFKKQISIAEGDAQDDTSQFGVVQQECDLMSLLPKDFNLIPHVTSINQKRKEMEQFNLELEKLVKKNASIIKKDYSIIINIVMNLLEDTNALVFMEAIKAIDFLSQLLKKQIQLKKSKMIIQFLIDKFKEIKPAVLQAVNKTLHTLIQCGCISMALFVEHVMDLICNVNKNPRVKQLVLEKINSRIQENYANDFSLNDDFEQMFKNISTNLLSIITKDNNNNVRDAAVQVLTSFKSKLPQSERVQEMINSLPKHRIMEINKKTSTTDVITLKNISSQLPGPLLSRSNSTENNAPSPLEQLQQNNKNDGDLMAATQQQLTKEQQMLKSMTPEFIDAVKIAIQNDILPTEKALFMLTVLCKHLQYILQKGISQNQIVALLQICEQKQQSELMRPIIMLRQQLGRLAQQQDVNISASQSKSEIQEGATSQPAIALSKVPLTIGEHICQLIDECFDQGLSLIKQVSKDDKKSISLVINKLLSCISSTKNVPEKQLEQMRALKCILAMRDQLCSVEDILSLAPQFLSLYAQAYLHKKETSLELYLLNGWLQQSQALTLRDLISSIIITYQSQQSFFLPLFEWLCSCKLSEFSNWNMSDLSRFSANIASNINASPIQRFFGWIVDKFGATKVKQFMEVQLMNSKTHYDSFINWFDSQYPLQQQFNQTEEIKAAPTKPSFKLQLDDQKLLKVKKEDKPIIVEQLDTDRTVDNELNNAVLNSQINQSAETAGRGRSPSGQSSIIHSQLYQERRQQRKKDQKLYNAAHNTVETNESFQTVDNAAESATKLANKTYEQVMQRLNAQLNSHLPSEDQHTLQITREECKNLRDSHESMNAMVEQVDTKREFQKASGTNEFFKTQSSGFVSKQSNRYDDPVATEESERLDESKMSTNRQVNAAAYQEQQQDWKSQINQLEEQRKKLEVEREHLKQENNQNSEEWKERFETMQDKHEQVFESLKQANASYLNQMSENEDLKNEIKQLRNNYEQLQEKIETISLRETKPPCIIEEKHLQLISTTFQTAISEKDSVDGNSEGIKKIQEFLVTTETTKADEGVGHPLIFYYSKIKKYEQKLQMIRAVNTSLKDDDILFAIPEDVYKQLLNFLLRVFSIEKALLERTSIRASVQSSNYKSQKQESNEITQESQRAISKLLNSKQFTTSLISMFQILRTSLPKDFTALLSEEDKQFLIVIVKCIQRINKALQTEAPDQIRAFDVLLEMNKIFTLHPPDNLREGLPSLEELDNVYRCLKDVTDKLIELQPNKIGAFLEFSKTTPRNRFLSYLFDIYKQRRMVNKVEEEEGYDSYDDDYNGDKEEYLNNH